MNELNDSESAFYTDVWAICQKHAVTSACITGTMNTAEGEHFCGMIAVDIMGLKDVADCRLANACFNAGRLWQHARMFMRHLLDHFERLP